MVPSQIFHPVWLALASTVTAIGLHSSHKGLLQVAPSFAGDGINLHPALHPSHDVDDLTHLLPHPDRELYYSQEGHRPALHGAKHAKFEAKFNHPTVVLEHSSYVKSIQCYPEDEAIEICMSSTQAYEYVERAWDKVDNSPDGKFNLVTYHVGCGDEASGKRSFFQVYERLFNPVTQCITAIAVPMKEEEALDSGKVSWGTYLAPDYRKRAPVKGHVRMLNDYKYRPRFNMAHMNDTVGTMDIENDPWALERFFNDSTIATKNFDQPLNTSLAPVDSDGWIESENNLSKRDGFSDFFVGIWNGIKGLVNKVIGFFRTAVEIIAAVAEIILTVAIVAAKLVAAAVGVPFEHSYHHDFKFDHYLKAADNDPPASTLGIRDGLKLQGIGGGSSIQCAKCGIHINFSVDGEMAFSIKDGITKGRLELKNHDQMRLDALFGITIDLEASKEPPKLKKQLAALPLSPLAIPGIITLGPQLSISVGVEIEVEGHIELLLGGSFVLEPGTAAVDLVQKEKGGIDGMEARFDPVFKAKGHVELTAALGLPIAIEVGLDVLNGKFKKTVGLVDTPAVYAKATVSVNEEQGDDDECKNGIGLSVGIKNEITAEAFDLWSKKIREDELWEKNLACVQFDGPKGPEKNDTTVFAAVDSQINTTAIVKSQGLQNVSGSLSSAAPTNQAFRIIMDADQRTILISGQDGSLYLVPKKGEYDVSAPWGTTDKVKNILTSDVFGRIMSYDYRVLVKGFSLATPLGVHNSTAIPKTHRATSLTMVKNKDGRETYGVPILYTELSLVGMGSGEGRTNNETYYPTACETEEGMRLFATRYLMDKKGDLVNYNGHHPNHYKRDATYKILKSFGAKNPKDDCRTIQLISNPKGTAT